MKTAETLLVCCVVGLASFIGGESVGVRRSAVREESAGAIDDARAGSTSRLIDSRMRREPDAGHGNARLVTSPVTDRADRPVLSPTERRRRIALGVQGTYINAVLLSRDSALARWPDRTTQPLRVFIREESDIDGWSDEYLPVVRDAFDSWVRVGIPVRFTFVSDTATADVQVRFTSALANGISGKTVWSRDAGHWLVSGDLQLAVLHPGGGFVTPPQLRSIAMHEIGHLLGLDHADVADAIMSARVRVRELSDADRATVRLLYTVPAGTLM